MTMVKEGTFLVESGSLIISDPAYDRDKSSWLQVKIPVKNGKWIAKVNAMKGAATSLMAVHEDHVAEKREWIGARGTRERSGMAQIGVDSGQAGIYDESSYPKGETGDMKDVDDSLPCDSAPNFYSKNTCNTLRIDHFGIVDGRGAVASTRDDGSFDVFKDFGPNGKDVVAVKIKFT